MHLRPALIAVTAIVLAVGAVTAVQAVTSKISSNNNLRLYGYAFNPAGYFTVDDDMVVTEKLNAKGNIFDSNGNLTLDDTVAVTGNMIIEGNAEIKGELFNTNDAVTINDDLYVTGSLIMNSMETPDSSGCDTPGGISYDADNLYICAGTTWKKVPLQSL